MILEQLFSLADINSFLYGENYRAFNFMGAHFCELGGVKGCRFAVWAPRAAGILLKGDFNDWQGTEMHRIFDSEIFAVFVPDVKPCAYYKYFIKTQDGKILEKADPFAFYAQQPMNNASRVTELGFKWHDHAFRRRKVRETFLEKPMSVYEVHLGSWKRKPDGSTYTYCEIAGQLLDYAVEMGFTHIEIMPITEYPLEDSWGYQVTGYFAPTSKYGTPADFMHFVDRCHRRGISVILDWVPSHFPKDAFALAEFDGAPLYEYADKRVGEHKQWGTLVFNWGKAPVVNFLLSSAVFWAEKYHIDGIRVDAVSSMLYLDYMRKDHIKNEYGGNENLEALAFLRRLNTVMKKEFPNVIMIAEEATDWNGITKPAAEGGMGFDFKWNMGWMNDILRYMARDPLHRKYHHNELTFSMMYAFKENYILPFSHDEVVHSELSMIGKMPGDYWQKFANLRLLYAYQYMHPGKKLMFMGNEFAQFIEWKYYDELEWFMLEYESHKKMQDFVKTLGRFYLENRALWQNETGWDGFQWINPDNREDSVLAFMRSDKSGRSTLLAVLNFTPAVKEDYRIGVTGKHEYIEVLNTDHPDFGGSGVTNGETVFKAQNIPWDKKEYSIALRLPPLACVVLKKLPKNKNGILN